MPQPRKVPLPRLPRSSRLRKIKQGLRGLSQPQVFNILKECVNHPQPAEALLARGLNARRLLLGWNIGREELLNMGYKPEHIELIGFREAELRRLKRKTLPSR